VMVLTCLCTNPVTKRTDNCCAWKTKHGSINYISVDKRAVQEAFGQFCEGKFCMEAQGNML